MQAQRLQIGFAFVAILFLSAFRHTDIEGHTDPNYIGYTFRTVVVQLPNASLSFRKQIIRQLEKRFKKYQKPILPARLSHLDLSFVVGNIAVASGFLKSRPTTGINIGTFFLYSSYSGCAFFRSCSSS